MSETPSHQPPGGISRSIRSAIATVLDPELEAERSGLVLVRVDVEARDGTVTPRLVAAVKVGDPASRLGEWKFAVEGEAPLDGSVRGRVTVEGKWTW